MQLTEDEGIRHREMAIDWKRMVTFLVWVFVARPAATGPGALLTLDQIVGKHVEALGGSDNIHKLQSIVIRGMYHEPGPIPDGTPIAARNYMAFMRPYYQVVGDPAVEHPGLREGFDGSAWEYYGDPGITIRTVGAAAAATRHTAEFLQDSLVDCSEKATKLELQGRENVGGHDTYTILVTLADGFQKYVFVDAATFLIVADRKAAPIHAFGQSINSEDRFEDYRSVQGVLIPFRILEVELSTGKILAESRKVSIEVNTLHDVSIFSPAPNERTPLQQFLEQLYLERTDAVSTMYSYNLFKSTHKAVDTREGVEFVGYQMAKMGDYATSVQLLKANASDYPDSASAQFGLGRAYKAAGDLEHAKDAFVRALQIDPNFKKATDGLNALR
jgi:Tetratricopeptide repeat